MTTELNKCLSKLSLGDELKDSDCTSVNLEGHTMLTNVQLWQVAKMPHLTSLNLSGCNQLEPHDFYLINKATNLKRLFLRGCPITPPLFTNIQNLPIEELDISETDLSPQDLTPLRKEELQILTMQKCPKVTPQNLMALRAFPNLLVLDISYIPYNEELFSTLPKIESLTNVLWKGSEIPPEKTKALPFPLLYDHWIRKLNSEEEKELMIERTILTKEQFEKIVQHKNLEKLELEEVTISMVNLFQMEYIPTLKVLILKRVHIPDLKPALWLFLSALKNLEHLELEGVEGAEIEELNLEKLSTLCIRSMPIGTKTVEMFYRLKALKKLDISQSTCRPIDPNQLPEKCELIQEETVFKEK